MKATDHGQAWGSWRVLVSGPVETENSLEDPEKILHRVPGVGWIIWSRFTGGVHFGIPCEGKVLGQEGMLADPGIELP